MIKKVTAFRFPPVPVLVFRQATDLILGGTGIFRLWRVLMKEQAESGAVFRKLWVGWQSRQMQVFNRYYLPCHRGLTLFCLGWLKDQDLAENVATDTLLKLLEQSRPEEIERVESWLFTVAKNRCLTLLEKQRRREGILNSLTPVLETEAQPTGELQLLAKDITAIIADTLNEKEWSIWRLHQEGYDNREIGERLGLPEKSVANVKSMARRKLQLRLAKERTTT